MKRKKSSDEKVSFHFFVPMRPGPCPAFQSQILFYSSCRLSSKGTIAVVADPFSLCKIFQTTAFFKTKSWKRISTYGLDFKLSLELEVSLQVPPGNDFNGSLLESIFPAIAPPVLRLGLSWKSTISKLVFFLLELGLNLEFFLDFPLDWGRVCVAAELVLIKSESDSVLRRCKDIKLEHLPQ